MTHHRSSFVLDIRRLRPNHMYYEFTIEMGLPIGSYTTLNISTAFKEQYMFIGPETRSFTVLFNESSDMI